MSKRDTIIYWSGFGVIMALLIVAPLVLPPFWQRFLTEILIWGLLAMSSDILIGYTGMVSFGHSAFFGLGMYGAAAALLMVAPPNLLLALAVRPGRRRRGLGLRRLFLDAAARHLLRHHHADLLADLLRHHLHLDRGDRRRERAVVPPAGARHSRPVDHAVHATTMHWFVLAVVAGSYLILRRIMRSPFGMVLQSIRENEPRTRAIGYAVERYKIVAVMLSGLFAGLAGVLYAVQNRFAAPDFVFFIVSGDAVIFNVMGGIGTLVGPIVGAATFLLLREGLGRLFGDQFPIHPARLHLHRHHHLHAPGPARLHAALAEQIGILPPVEGEDRRSAYDPAARGAHAHPSVMLFHAALRHTRRREDRSAAQIDQGSRSSAAT